MVLSQWCDAERIKPFRYQQYAAIKRTILNKPFGGDYSKTIQTKQNIYLAQGCSNKYLMLKVPQNSNGKT